MDADAVARAKHVVTDLKRSWRPKTVALWAVFAVVAVLLTGRLFFNVGLNVADRVELEHSISVPESVTEIQAHGNASGFLKLFSLDRGASSIVVFDRDDLSEFLGQFTWESSDNFNSLWNNGPSPAPGNLEFQPDSVPWDVDVEPESRQCTQTPPGTADFACVWTYTVEDSDSVGIWIYTDWN